MIINKDSPQDKVINFYLMDGCTKEEAYRAAKYILGDRWIEPEESTVTDKDKNQNESL